MIAHILIAAALAVAQTPVWTWSLYEGPGPVVLANERPDTPDLRSTLECSPHTGVIHVSLYQSAVTAGSASVSSGDAVAAVEATLAEDGAVVAPLRADHPVFARFVSTGDLSIAVGSARQAIKITTPDLAKLRRFADLCSG